MSQRRPAFRLSDGTVVYDIIGADSGEDEDAEDQDEDDDANGDDDDDSDEEAETVETLKAKLEEAEKARARAERRMKNADKAKSKEVLKRQQAENAGKSELDLAKERIAQLEADLAEKSKVDPRAVLRDGFRDLEQYQWHDRKLAFEQLDLSEVELNDDGSYDADDLADAVEKLAKARPYLLKKAADADDEDEEEEEPKPKSGNNPGRKKRQNTTDRDVLKKKFPQLASRS